ncbi:hypothetical protein D3C85_1339690 [compost metagenome]
MGILAIGGRHPVLAGVQLAGEEEPGFLGMGPGPLLGTQHSLDDQHGGIEVFVQEVLVDGQRAWRADVAANQRVGVRAGVDHHVQAELVGELDAMRALEEDRVDVAAQQADQFVVAPAHAVALERHLGAEHMAHRLVAVGAAVGVVHQFDLGDAQALQLQGVLEPAQSLGATEVDLHIGPLRQAEAAVAQVADGLHSAFR